MAFPNHPPHPLSGFPNRCRGDQDQRIEWVAEPVDQTPNSDAMGLAGGLWTRNPKIIPLAGFLKNPLRPRIPLKTILVFLCVVRPEQFNDSPKVPILSETTTLWSIVVPKGDKLNGNIGGTDWPDSAISFKALTQADRLQKPEPMHKYYIK